MDAEPVRHGGDGSESPAGAAATLVTDFTESWARWPLLAGIEGIGDVFDAEQLVLEEWRTVEVSVRVDSHQSFEEVVAGGGVEVSAGSPCRFGGVDLFDEVVTEDVVVVDSDGVDADHGQQAKKKQLHIRRFVFLCLRVGVDSAKSLN